MAQPYTVSPCFPVLALSPQPHRTHLHEFFCLVGWSEGWCCFGEVTLTGLWEIMGEAVLLHIQWFLKCCICLSGGKETQHDVWKYNSSINKWIQIEYLNIGRWRHKMVVLGGKVYVLGGFDGLQRINNVETYDPFHNCWSEV